MKKILFLLPVMLLAFAGCSSVSDKQGKKAPEVPELAPLTSETQLKTSQEIAGKFAAALAASLKQKSFIPWSQAMPPGRKITEKMFLNMFSDFKLKYGDFVSLTEFGELDQGVVRDYLWKMRFMKPAAPPAKGVPHEILFWVRIYQENGKAPAIGGFGFKSF
jgi:hypothetical protein